MTAMAAGPDWQEHLKRCPGIRPCLSRLCAGLSRRSALPRKTSLGPAPGPREREALLALFGAANLKSAADGNLILSPEGFFAGLDGARRAVCIDALLAALEWPREKTAAARKLAETEADTLLQKLRLAFPSLLPVHGLLKTQRARWTRRILREGAAPVERLLFDAGYLAAFLQENRRPLTPAELGAEVLGDSKALKREGLPGLLAEWLRALDPEAQEGANPKSLLAARHVLDNPGAVKVTFFASLAYRKLGRRFDFPHQLHEVGEAATLSWENLDRVEAVELQGPGSVLACENESPFARLSRQGFKGCLIYTQGFPNAAVLKLWELLGRSHPEREFLHWGDSDPAGLHIAALLHRVHPLRLWRCALADLEAHRQRRRLRPLDAPALSRGRALLTSQPGFPFRPELEFTLAHGWLEQESWMEWE